MTPSSLEDLLSVKSARIAELEARNGVLGNALERIARRESEPGHWLSGLDCAAIAKNALAQAAAQTSTHEAKGRK